MIPLHFEVTSSKVKVTLAFNANPCPLNVLKSLWMTVILLSRKIDHGQKMTPIKFKVSRSKVKDTVECNAKNVFAQYLNKFMSDSHSTR